MGCGAVKVDVGVGSAKKTGCIDWEWASRGTSNGFSITFTGFVTAGNV